MAMTMPPVRGVPIGSHPVGRTNSLPYTPSFPQQTPQNPHLLPKSALGLSLPKAVKFHESGEREQFALNSTAEGFLRPGDLICVKGSPDNLTSIGSNGGFMGHVMLVTGPPQIVKIDNEAAIEFANIWPKGDVSMLLLVPTMESCRSEEGFYEAEYLMYVDSSRQARLLGEKKPDSLCRFELHEQVYVYQSPDELRNNIKEHLMDDVLDTMRSSYQGSWSWGTAIRAYLFSADVENTGCSRGVGLEDIQKCWSSDPICTSTIIVFWQRYLTAVADEWNDMRWPHEERKHAFDMICQYMPLKADRSLPADLIRTLERCGWTWIPQVYAPSMEGQRRRSFTI